MIRISQGLDGSDLNDLKYLCGAVAPESALENVETSTDLFTLLQYHGSLGPGCYDFIKTSLLSIGRNDLASILPNSQENDVQYCCNVQSKDYSPVKHRSMLVTIADRLRREDIVKLVYISTGKVKISDSTGQLGDSVLAALQILAGFEEANLLQCDSYSVLSDLLRQIGRCDLADFVVGFPRYMLPGFTKKGQALNFKMKVLLNKKSVYFFYNEMLGAIKGGDTDALQHIHSAVVEVCVNGLDSRCEQSRVSCKLLRNAFDSQYKFLQCVMSNHLKHKKMFLFVNKAFDDDEVTGPYPCPVAETAHQVRRYVLEVSCEIIGKEKATKVHQLNHKIECGINICSRFAKHVFSLLSTLASLLSAVSLKTSNKYYKTELLDIITNHKIYITAAFPSLLPFVKSEILQDVLKVLQEPSISMSECISKEVEFSGVVAMIIIPAYSILLNLFGSLSGHTIDPEEILRKLAEYVHSANHIKGSKEFVTKCAAALYDAISCFKHDIIELDDLCAPLIRQLVI